MTDLRAIDAKPLVAAAGDLPPIDAGKQPYLEWLAVNALMVDPTYQRDITETGRRNILRIAREFEWSRFATVVVTPHAHSKFVIIDGQHRTTAAALRGIDKVPCQIVTADAAKQALAFAAINANVTKMSTMQLHAARVAAGDPDAVRLKRVCESGGVTLLRYPIQTQNQKVGETMAVVQLRQALDRYGEKALRVALQCITKTRDGNPGMVRGLIVAPLCAVLEGNACWLDQSQLPAAFEDFDFSKAFAEAGQQTGGYSRAGVHNALMKIFSAFLTKALGTASAPAAAVPSKTAPQPTPSPAEGATYNGVTVDLSGCVAYAARKLKMLPREALLVGLLARAFGNPVGHQFLIKRVWARQATPHDAADELELMAKTIAARLAGIGLEIKVVKGAGIVLREAR